MSASWKPDGGAAVITGGASGIGLATAQQLASAGMSLALIDRDSEALDKAAETLRQAGVAADRLLIASCDVSDLDALRQLSTQVQAQLGQVRCLMNNAGALFPTGTPWEEADKWRKLLEVNLWGVINGCQAFLPAMLEAGERAVVINTGSKQGLTRPPGNYAYNLSKAGVIAYTECLSHALWQTADGAISAHLLIPGFTYTGMIASFLPEKPPAAWSSEQVADFMLDSLQRGDFYILCPDNDVTRQMDEKRLQWNTDDVIRNRPALSRWHPDFAEEFEKFIGK